jgi:hypothetical protein
VAQLPTHASNAALRWLRDEAGQASGLEAWISVPPETDFRYESVVRVNRARGRNVHATPREIEWSEVHYRAFAISRDLEVALAAQEDIEAALHDTQNAPASEGVLVRYVKSVDTLAYEEGEGEDKVYHCGVEFEVKVQPAP